MKITAFITSSILFLAIPFSQAGTLTQTTDVPVSDVLLAVGDESPSGSASNQATFGYRNADAPGTEGTRGRGQSFAINSATAATYSISSISVSLGTSSASAARPEGDLLFTVFEYIGTGATAAAQTNDDSDWITKTDGTSGTQVYSGSFPVAAGTNFLSTNLLTVSLDPGELQLDANKAYGFLFQYKLDSVAGLTADVTIGFDADNNTVPDGILLSTTPNSPVVNNTASTSRDLNYFITGTVVGGLASPTITASSPLIVTGDPVDLDIAFSTGADTAVLTTPGGPVDLKALDATDSGPNDGFVTVSDTPVSTYTYEVVLTKAGNANTSATVKVLVADPAGEAADNAFSTLVKGDSPLFYYRYEEAANTDFLLDSSGNGHHTADIIGTLDQGTGPGGMQNAGDCSGNISVGVPTTSEMSQSFTLMAMMNVDPFDDPNLRNIFSMTDGTGVGRSILYYGNGGFKTFIDGSAEILSDETVVPSQTSCLIHMIYDAAVGTAGEIRLYINGQLTSSVLLDLPVTLNDGQWILCANKTRSNFHYLGWIDETAVFESVLSNAQIAAHGAAYFDVADPLLGFYADTLEVTSGGTVNLGFKISDLATGVTINGNPVDITSGGGVYSVPFAPTAGTTYTLVVTGPGGPFTRTVTVTVVAPPAPPKITSISVTSSSPPEVTLTFTGPPNTTYNLKASATLMDGFVTQISSVTTNASGVGTTSFTGEGSAEFYRLETIPAP